MTSLAFRITNAKHRYAIMETKLMEGNGRESILKPTVDLNVVVFPDRTVSRRLIEWSLLLAECYKTSYVLNTEECLPHLSLYSARYPLVNVEGVADIVQRLAKSRKIFDLTLLGFSVFAGYIFYNALPNATLQGLHEQLVDQLNPK